MTEITEKLKLELSGLSVEDRVELAYFLIRSLDEGMDDDIEIAWGIELTKRLQEIYNGTANGELSDQVLLQLREKYS